ncbi:helix-turn-helix transcriptional regulator [Enterobacter hormaechei]
MTPTFPIRTLHQLRPILIGFRKAKGLTQKEVAELLGVTQQTYARLEANPESASFSRLFRLFSLLGIKIELSYISPSSAPDQAEVNSNSETTPNRREKW